MNFSQFLLILRVRYKIILLIMISTIGITVAISLVLPKKFQATATVLLNYKGVDPVTGMTIPAQLMPGYIPTQVDIIQSRNVTLKVIEALKLDQNKTAKQDFLDSTQGRGTIQDWLAGLLEKKLEVVPSRESSLIEIIFSGADPNFVAAVANAYAEAYQRTALQLKIEPAQKAASFLGDQTKSLREHLEQAQSNLSKYQQEKGITSIDERLDSETSRMNELTAQLVLAQSQAIEAGSRQRGAAGSGASMSPDVLANPLVQNLKSQLVQAEGRLADLSQKYSANHPQYQSAKAEVDKIRVELQREINTASSGVSSSAKIYKSREEEIRAELSAQKARLLELNRHRDRLQVLQREVENAQQALNTTTQRQTQSSLESQVNQSDVAILNPATPPIEPAGPKLVLNTLVSIFLGSMLGVGFALLLEMIDRRVRSMEDIDEVIGITVLGVISAETQRRGRRELPPPSTRLLLPGN